MFLLDWYREYLEIKYDSRQRRNEVVEVEKVCESCETLKTQLEIVNDEKRRLIDRILERPEKEPEPKINPNPIPIMPRHTPFAVRRQMLEAEDRKKAELMRSAPKPDKESIEDLEKELHFAEQTRENTIKENLN